jgi:hypothetical protein
MAVRPIATSGRSGSAARASAATDASRWQQWEEQSVVAAARIVITTHDADGDHHCLPCPRWVAMVVARMTMAGKMGNDATARGLQGNDEATRTQRQLVMVPAQMRLIELVVQAQGKVYISTQSFW